MSLLRRSARPVAPPEPSATALAICAARAAHLRIDGEPHILADPLAAELLDKQHRKPLEQQVIYGRTPVLSAVRVIATLRSRVSEDLLAASGLDQYVVLGAGLDTSALRLAGPWRTWELDLPATERWKRQRLADLGVEVPASVAFVEGDLLAPGWVDALVAAGLDLTRPAHVAVLGVLPYLDADGVEALVATLGGWAPGTVLVADHLLDASHRTGIGRVSADEFAAIVDQKHEPWLSAWSPAGIVGLLERHGFVDVRHGDLDAIVDPALWQRRDGLVPDGLNGIVVGRVGARSDG